MQLPPVWCARMVCSCSSWSSGRLLRCVAFVEQQQQLNKLSTFARLRHQKGLAPRSFPSCIWHSASFRWQQKCTHTGQHKCWKCSKLRPTTELSEQRLIFFCECGIVQQPDTQFNYFQLFGLPEHFKINQSQLSREMRQLQFVLHPDKFAAASSEERDIAQQQSARVNEAYSCLSSPLSRAQYLLSLKGVDVANDTADDSDSSAMSQEFLSDMLELNEALMEADHDNVAELRRRVEADTEQLIDKLNAAFDESDYQQAKELLYQLRYYTNIINKINENH